MGYVFEGPDDDEDVIAEVTPNDDGFILLRKVDLMRLLHMFDED